MSLRDTEPDRYEDDGLNLGCLFFGCVVILMIAALAYYAFHWWVR